MAGGDPATAIDDRLLSKVDRVQAPSKIGHRTVAVFAEIAAVEEASAPGTWPARGSRVRYLLDIGPPPGVDDGSAAVDGGDNLISGDDPCPMRRTSTMSC